MEIDKQAVGGRIKSIRLSEGKNTREFGEIFDPPASDSIVSRWESGKSLPNAKRLRKISDRSQISVDELLYGNEHHYLVPFVIDIAKNYYDWDISKDKRMINHIFNRLDFYSYEYNEHSLFENNKDVFDRILRHPWE